MTVLGDTDENNAVEQPLNNLVQLFGGEAGIVLVDVFSQFLTPAGHLLEEGGVHGYAEALGAAVARQHGLQRTR